MSAPGEVLGPDRTAQRLSGSAFVQLRGALHAVFTTPDFATGTRLAVQVTEVAEAANHHPDIAYGWGRIEFTLSSHEAGGVTERDLHLAEQIQVLAEKQGAVPDLRRPSDYELCIDCTNEAAISGFWMAGLNYQERRTSAGERELFDPRRAGPTVWFQHMDVPRLERNRIHVDVYVPAEDAESRVHAIEKAGGVLLTAEHAPEWWVLADVEGNELCVCT
ncbi:MAG: 4a-hydroxytetrahydrobiopterin dehydratase [Microbacteriaceae bacterium]|nr:MAG: 4a-hydroxytetrahydrobiopterin dehydratase [Microbacteriaceae bacterium]